MSANVIQSIIDEDKENMTDDLYLKLSNALMIMHNDTVSLYEAITIVPKFIPVKGGVVRYESQLRTMLIRMKNTIADSYIEELNISGQVHLCTHLFNGTIDPEYEIYDTNTDLLLNDDDDENEFNVIRCAMPVVTCVKLCKI